MKRFSLPLLIVFVVAVAATVIVSAQDKQAPGKGHKEMCPIPAQVRGEVEKLTLQHRLDSIDLKTRRAELRGQMMDELLKDKPDAKALEKIAKEMDGVRAKLHRQRVEHLLKVKKALPEQHWKVYLHKQCGSFMGDCCCMHGAGGGRGCGHGAMGGAHGGAGCSHGAMGGAHGGAGCSHGAMGGAHGGAGCSHGAAGCAHGGAGSKHGAGGCPMAAPAAGVEKDLCPLGKHGKAKK